MVHQTPGCVNTESGQNEGLITECMMSLIDGCQMVEHDNEQNE